MNHRQTLKKSRNTGLMLVIAAITVLSAANFGDFALASDQGRVTTSFDVRYSSAVLHQVAHLFTGGFGRAEADRVSQEIDSLRADQSRAWQFQVQYEGRAETLGIHALLDDLGMIDLDFAASPEVAPKVRAAVDNYLNGRSH